MFNYKNLCDYEFEILCKDIMQKKLGVPFQIFARGRDGGIDITDDTVSKNVVIQVNHTFLLLFRSEITAVIIIIVAGHIQYLVRYEY